MSHSLAFHVRLVSQTVICAVCLCAPSQSADDVSPSKKSERLSRPPLTIDLRIDRSVEIPPPRTHYMGREIAQTMHYTGAPWLVRESRQREEDCRLLLEALQIQPGQTICDLGCGNGFYTL
ncbi:MAG: class I SAM-dependent methyltransferase [Pirellulales bacterium]|nr:class I SAM-dependent methyltransferase [Pirellulales bacterium]